MAAQADARLITSKPRVTKARRVKQRAGDQHAVAPPPAPAVGPSARAQRAVEAAIRAHQIAIDELSVSLNGNPAVATPPRPVGRVAPKPPATAEFKSEPLFVFLRTRAEYMNPTSCASSLVGPMRIFLREHSGEGLLDEIENMPPKLRALIAARLDFAAELADLCLQCGRCDWARVGASAERAEDDAND